MPYKEVLEKKEKNMDAEGEKAKDQIWRYPLQRKRDATVRVNFARRAS
jgi:leucyl aminopeptidase